jgi:hypothetical protein
VSCACCCYMQAGTTSSQHAALPNTDMKKAHAV